MRQQQCRCYPCNKRPLLKKLFANACLCLGQCLITTEHALYPEAVMIKNELISFKKLTDLVQGH